MFTKSQGLPKLDRPIPGREMTTPAAINVRETLVESLDFFEHIAKTQPMQESTSAQLLTLIAKIKEVLKWI